MTCMRRGARTGWSRPEASAFRIGGLIAIALFGMMPASQAQDGGAPAGGSDGQPVDASVTVQGTRPASNARKKEDAKAAAEHGVQVGHKKSQANTSETTIRNAIGLQVPSRAAQDQNSTS